MNTVKRVIWNTVTQVTQTQLSKKQETRLILHEHDDDDDDAGDDDDDDEQWQEVKSIIIMSGLWDKKRGFCVRFAAEAQIFSA
jgi:hypothetical protein